MDSTGSQSSPRLVERFNSKVRITSTCHEWTGYCDPNGYGRFRTQGVVTYAHRFAYELHNGPVPDGLHVDHLCRNRKCVNPAHLQAVTVRENVMRPNSNAAPARRARGEVVTSTKGISRPRPLQATCRQGHPMCGENLYVRPSGKRVCRECMRHHRREHYARSQSTSGRA